MTSELKKYMKIIRHGKSGTHLILQENDDIIIQEKLDGANASFKVDNGMIKCFSRNTELNEENTLRGFYNWVNENIDPNELLDGVIYFGEWLVKHKLDYGDNMDQFYLFDIYNTHLEKYVSFPMVRQEAKRLNLNLVPVFYEGKFQSIDHIKSFVGQSKLGDIGEGIVIKNVNYKDKFGNQQFTKIVSDEFAEKAKVKKHKVSTAKDSLDEFIDTYLTEARVEKLLNKLVDENIINESYGIEDMGVILKNSASRMYEDLIEEELDALLSQLKKKVGKKYPVMVRMVLSQQGRC